MNQSEAKDFLPIIEAWSEGKTIQFSLSPHTTDWGDLSGESDVYFTHPVKQYRVKPEPKLRPWRVEEVPVGAVIRKAGCLDTSAMITGILNGKPLFGLTSLSEMVTYFADHARDPLLYEYSLDFGKTWSPCGVEE